jgi:ATP-dependent Clp protease ATP-binding subunit ClpA
VVFSPLTVGEVKEIAGIYLASIAANMEHYGRRLEVTPQALERIVELGYSSKYGARFLKRKIDDLVKIPVTHEWKEGESFKVTLDGSEVVVDTETLMAPLLM